MICGRENGTSGCHLAVFSEDVALSRHLVATLPPLALPLCRSASGIGYTSKSYLKWHAIQLAIHSIIGEYR